MATALPYIFVLDWDGTVVGKVDFQSNIFTLHQTLKQLGIKIPASAKPLASAADAFGPSHKLVRPYFADFIKAVSAFYPQVYFFIYTASTKTWAHQEIAWVEKIYGIEFMRPIFTRDDCLVDRAGNYKKSLAKVFPRICRAVQAAGYTAPFSTETRKMILEKRTMIIDNRAVYVDGVDKLLLCPDYDYAVFDNLLDYIPESIRHQAPVQQLILSWVNQGLMCPAPQVQGGAPGAGDSVRAMVKMYSWLAAKCKSLVEINKAYENDDFWLHLTKLIAQNHLKVYSPSVIKQLQSAIWTRRRPQTA